MQEHGQPGEGGAKSLSAASSSDYNALVVHQILWEKGNFPLWHLLGKVFVIVCGWA